VTVAPLPSFVLGGFPLKETPPPEIHLERIPSALLSTLLPFQREGVMFALQKEGRALIGDEMGLGKTFQALAVAAYYRNEWPVLVVVPSSLRCQWAEVFEKWIPDLPPADVHIIQKGYLIHVFVVTLISLRDMLDSLVPRRKSTIP